MNITIIARVCHEAYKAWCEGNNDYSQKHWDDAEIWQRDSTLHTIQFLLNNPDLTIEAIHAHWVTKKISEGWKYGIAKNDILNTHPDLVPFEQLSNFAKKKDSLFKAIVNALK